MPQRAPTNAELEILRVLWQRGPSTVRDVHQSLDHAKPVGYTTVLKLLQIMTEKNLVTRDASTRSHIYAAAASQAATQRRMVADLVQRAFGGLGRLARAQPNAEVREEAVEQYARIAAPESALDLLVDRLANDSSSAVQVEAVERLGELPDGLGIPALREAARSHPRRQVRVEARHRLEAYR